MTGQCTIGGLAKQTGVHIETIRYYQRRGLLEEPVRPARGVRRYGGMHVRRLRFIRKAQALGFALEEVRELLALDDGRHCREASRLGARKLATVRERIRQLRGIERALARLVRRCDTNTGRIRCPLIDAIGS